MFWNLYGTICIATYHNFFHIYRLNPNNNVLTFQKQIRETIMSGYFFENLFFFATESEVFLLVSELKNDVILIKLATIEFECNLPFNLHEYEEENIELFDTIYPKLQKRSPGHLKFLLIFDCKLITINQFQEMGAIALDHAFIKFCMHLQFEEIEKCLEIIKKFDDNLHYIFADLFNVWDFYSINFIEFLLKVLNFSIFKYHGLQEYVHTFKGFDEIENILMKIENCDESEEIINVLYKLCNNLYVNFVFLE